MDPTCRTQHDGPARKSARDYMNYTPGSVHVDSVPTMVPERLMSIMAKFTHMSAPSASTHPHFRYQSLFDHPYHIIRTNFFLRSLDTVLFNMSSVFQPDPHSHCPDLAQIWPTMQNRRLHANWAVPSRGRDVTNGSGTKFLTNFVPEPVVSSLPSGSKGQFGSSVTACTCAI